MDTLTHLTLMHPRQMQRVFALILPLIFGACTAQIPKSFEFFQQNQSFSAVQANTKVDMLWVVDNSASMDVSQEKLRQGFASFANKYMKPTWDIRIAVIPTDVYLANAAFTNYLNTTISGTTGYVSNYIKNYPGAWQNPAWNPTLVNTGTGAFTNGVKYKEVFPGLQSNYSRLLAGKHDGPVPAICFELLPYFIGGVTDCAVRDAKVNTGTATCLSPGGGQDSASECVNTLQNDSVRSGKAILATKPPTGTPGDAAWVNQLISDFIVNATTSSAGNGSERGFASVLQLLADNENTASKFFRAGAFHAIVFISDEEEQSLNYPSPVPGGFSPNTDYACDQAALVAANPTKNITGVNGYCCNVGANNCTYGSAGITCASKTVDGFTYTPSVCANPAKLMSVATVKAQLDTFFNTLDGTTGTNTKYMIASIIPNSAASIQALQADRTAMDTALNQVKTIATDKGVRYEALGNLVGNGSLVADIGDADYTPILYAIGEEIAAVACTWKLNFTPTSVDDMIVTLVQIDGSSNVIPSNQLSIVNGNNVKYNTDLCLANIKADTTIFINYQPINNNQ